jgi:hypothetical protein
MGGKFWPLLQSFGEKEMNINEIIEFAKLLLEHFPAGSWILLLLLVVVLVRFRIRIDIKNKKQG